MPPGGPAAELYMEIPVPPAAAETLRREWQGFGVTR
jgi:hypothetical protein